MLNTYSEIVTHPMFYLVIALTALIYGVQWATSLPIPKLRINQGWLRQNYVWLILSAVGGLFACAMLFYLVEVAWSLRGVVDRLGDTLKTPDADTGDLRNLAYAIGALIAVLAGSATILFSLIKVWINERTTTATEQGLITDRINKAVEGLGAEKEVKKFNNETSVPNIEVRIGSILALERLAKQNLDFHIQIMEILCAYVRQNAQLGQENPPDKPRSDIQMAMTVLGRRSPSQIAIERNSKIPGTDFGYRMDLRNCQLDGVDLTGLDFSYSQMDNSSLQRAVAAQCRLGMATLHSTNLAMADLSKSVLHGAKFLETNLTRALFFKANAQEAVFRYCTFSKTSLFVTIRRGPRFRPLAEVRTPSNSRA